MRQLLMLASFMVVSAGSFAASNITYTCALDGAERLIEVVYLESGQELPCEVRYSKEGETQVLWTYANEIGQCEAKAAAFAEKQASWGWQCETISSGTEDLSTDATE